MPANSRDSIHHHRACKGKAHASGIIKQNCRANISSGRSTTSKSKPSPKDQKPSQNVRYNSDGRSSSDGRKLSRNSTSSWDYSDSDSMNSSEPGLNSESLQDSTSQMISRIDQVLDDIDCAKSIYHNDKLNDSRSSKSNMNYSNSPSKRFLKKKNWEDSLRSGNGYIDDRVKKMEAGWDDSSVIKNPKERKWHRITADAEQRENGHDKVARRNSLPKKTQPGKVLKRTRSSPTRRRPLYDVIEWDEILEMALARKFGSRKKRNGEQDVGYLKNLEVLLENKAPLNVQVRCA